MKEIEGKLYKCVNCEEYTLCTECFTKNKASHHASHIFCEILKPLKVQDINPTVMMQVFDPRLYSQIYKLDEELESPAKTKQEVKSTEKVLAQEDGAEDEDDFEDLAPLGIQRSLSQPLTLSK